MSSTNDAITTIAITYRRVSSDRQEREGVSLDVQTDQCIAYIRRQSGWRLGGDFQDTMSGRKVNRPQYRAMLAEVRALRAQGQRVVIVTAALDRMGRDLGESVRARKELRQLNVALHCVREGGELQEMQADILASVAADESRRIAARVKGSQTRFRTSGWRTTSAAPWGYQWVEATDAQRLKGSPKVVLALDPKTENYAREAWQRAANGETVHQVTRWIASLPNEARGGRVLRFANVLHMFKNPTYIKRVENPERGIVERERKDPVTGEPVIDPLTGLPITTKTRIIPTPDLGALALPGGHWPAMIDDETWTAVHQRLASHAVMPLQASGEYLLSGLLRCMKCGLRMQGKSKYGGTPQPSYACSTPARGCNFSVRAATIERAVLDEIDALLSVLVADAAEMKAMRQEWTRLQKPPERPHVARVKSLERIISQARRRMDALMDDLADKVVTREQYQRKVSEWQGDVDAASAELAEIRTEEAPPVLPSFDEMIALAGGWRTAMTDATVQVQRDVLREFLVQITPVRTGWGKYDIEPKLTAFGNALRSIRKPAAA